MPFILKIAIESECALIILLYFSTGGSAEDLEFESSGIGSLIIIVILSCISKQINNNMSFSNINNHIIFENL